MIKIQNVPITHSPNSPNNNLGYFGRISNNGLYRNKYVTGQCLFNVPDATLLPYI